VSVDLVLQVLEANVRLAQETLYSVIARLEGGIGDCACYHALENALITARGKIPAETVARLEPIVGKYLR
jgi:5'-methylthioadenosine phosphorylase